MRNFIFNFSQENLIKNNLTMPETLVLDYIYQFEMSGRMQTEFFDGLNFVKISFQKIIDDLPILKLGLRTLQRFFKKYSDIGILTRGTGNFFSFNWLYLTGICDKIVASEEKNDKIVAFSNDLEEKNDKIVAKNATKLSRNSKIINSNKIKEENDNNYNNNIIYYITNNPEKRELWSNTLNEIKSRVSSVSFELYFQSLIPIKIEDDVIYIQTRSEEKKNQLLKLHSEKFLKVLQDNFHVKNFELVVGYYAG